METLSFTIPGAPRTKKNSSQIVRAGARPRILPSCAYRTWAAQALPALRAAAARARLGPIAEPVNCRALIYRDALRGDAVGFYQAIADLLEDAGILENDRWVVAWDGSRMLKDAARPRVEILLTVAP